MKSYFPPVSRSWNRGNFRIQLSYLLSYFPDKYKSYEKAKQATETINKARLQDVQNKTIQRTYYQFLAYQLSLSDDPNIDIRVSEIIEFLDTNKSSNRQVIGTKISLSEYFINSIYTHIYLFT